MYSIPAFDLLALFRGEVIGVHWVFGYFMPDWWPKISWPWFICVGCVVTLAISVLFRTPQSQIDAAEAHVRARS